MASARNRPAADPDARRLRSLEARGAATVCPRCGTDNQPGAKFCIECGSALGSACPGCGASTTPGQNFCAECGEALAPRSASSSPFRPGTSGAEGPGPALDPRSSGSAELRRVSVVFVDLVGYTSLSELLDPEDVRDLLGQYFDAARTIVDHYGGTIEKFIGDAVMAVWGTPVAREDDAERAVRAALQMVDAVAVLRPGAGAGELRARAGVVTGQAALLSSPQQGVVVGDRVNTAARVQAAAEPGTVLVDDVTRQVTSSAIVYEDAGHHELKGKADPLHLWRAFEVIGLSSGQDREGLQARFVGRDADLRLIEELFDAGVARRSMRLVAVSGPAGVGKSRLRSEFLAYLMRLPQRFLWHPGRCLPYGDGVAYWALAEMVRHRLGIAEDAPEEETEAKLETGLAHWIDDVEEREFLAPRLGVLLGVAHAGAGREELFAAWRLFFERLSEHDPVLLAFEDMHWADDGLLDFVEDLLDWSGRHPIFVLSFARPELSERRPGWPSGHRGATSLSLEPLGDEAMEELLDSIATLPQTATQRIISHAEGIPLYAIETVRALTDRGALIERDGALVLSGELGELDVPPSLISLLSARLDALAPEERDLVKKVSVFAGNFPLAGAQALSGLPERAADAVLARLVRKQVLTVRAEPLSPDRGQYRFAQAMLRTVAYDMLSKRERKSGHLAAGEYLSRTFANQGEDVAEVVADHYLQAYRYAAQDGDADQLRAAAVAALRRGARRAADLGAPRAAERAYRRGIELAGGEHERVELIEAAGDMALVDGRYEPAIALLEDAESALQHLGRDREAASLATKIGHALRLVGRTGEAVERMRRALVVMERDGADAAAAQLNVELGVALLSSGRVEEAAGPLERGLELAQAYELPEVLANALTYKAQLCVLLGRAEEARIMFDGAIELCRRHELTERRFVAEVNGGDFLRRFDLPGAAQRSSDALTGARRIGSRFYESVAASNLMMVWLYTGHWGELERLGAELLAGESTDRPGVDYLHLALILLSAQRGELAQAREHLAGMELWRRSDVHEHRWSYAMCEATIALAAGDFPSVLELLSGTMSEIIDREGASSQVTRVGFPCVVEAALNLGRTNDAAALLSLLADRPPGHVPPFLRAQLSRGQGLIAAGAGRRGEAEAELRGAIETLRELGYPHWLARVQTDLATLLIDHGRADEARPLVDQAVGALRALSARPGLERVERLASAYSDASSLSPSGTPHPLTAS